MSQHDYTSEIIRGCLSNLQEMRALDLTGNGRDDSPDTAQLRESFRCMLWDLEQAVRQLPEPLRLAVYWRCDRGLTEREAAEQLGVRLYALQQRIKRAEQAIAKILSRPLVTPPK